MNSFIFRGESFEYNKRYSISFNGMHQKDGCMIVVLAGYSFLMHSSDLLAKECSICGGLDYHAQAYGYKYGYAYQKPFTILSQDYSNKIKIIKLFTVNLAFHENYSLHSL